MEAATARPALAERPPQRRRRIALTVVLGIAFLLAAWIVSPLWIGLLLGAVMAFAAQPAFDRLEAKMKHRRKLAAALVTIGFGLGALVLLAGVMYIMTNELVVLAGELERRVAKGTLEDMVGPGIARLIDHLHVPRDVIVTRIHEELGAAATWLARGAAVAAQTVTHAGLGLLIALFTMDQVLAASETTSDRFVRLFPLEPRHTRALLQQFRQAGRNALVGTLATALVQGLLACVGYAIAGVSSALTWGVLTAIASFIPVVGTFIVWVPIGIYEIVTGHVVAGIFLFAWGVLVVSSLSDYVIRPRLVGSTEHLPPLLMLIALLGGIEVLGLAGLVVGPILMSLFLAVLRIYEREVAVEGPEVGDHDANAEEKTMVRAKETT